MKKHIYALMAILALCLLSLALTGCTFSFSGMSVYANAEKYSVGNVAIEEPVRTLEIGWNAGEVRIVYDDGDTIRVSETANRDLTEETTLHYWLDGTTLHVKFAASGALRTGGTLQKTLTLTVPRDTVFASVKIAGGSAAVKAETLAATRVGIDTGSGNIDVSVLPAFEGSEADPGTEVELDTASGEIRAVVSGFAEVELDTASGNVYAEITGVPKIKADSSSGKVDLTIAGGCDSCNVDTASGSVTVEATDKIGRLSVDTGSGAARLTLDGADDLEIDTSSGDVTLTVAESCGFTLRVDTASGNFEYDMPLSKQGKTYVYGDGAANFDIDTASGDVTIRKKQKN